MHRQVRKMLNTSNTECVLVVADRFNKIKKSINKIFKINPKIDITITTREKLQHLNLLNFDLALAQSKRGTLVHLKK